MKDEISKMGPLQISARFGNKNLAISVLNDRAFKAAAPDMFDHVKVQAAFFEALKRGVNQSFDRTMVEELLKRGAKASGVPLHALFESSGGSSEANISAGRFGLLRHRALKRAGE
eukprot:5428661-Prymnesium_polylepis.1